MNNYQKIVTTESQRGSETNDVFERLLDRDQPFVPQFVQVSTHRDGWKYKISNEYKDSIRFELRDVERVMYYIEYSISRGRVFAPCQYIIDHDGKLDRFKWRFVMRKSHSVFDYWKICLDRYKEYFELTQISRAKYLINSTRSIPHPDTINVRTRRLTWRLNGKCVTISDYFREWEQRYVNALPLK